MKATKIKRILKWKHSKISKEHKYKISFYSHFEIFLRVATLTVETERATLNQMRREVINGMLYAIKNRILVFTTKRDLINYTHFQ